MWMVVWADFLQLAWKRCMFFLPTFHWLGHGHIATFKCNRADKCGLIVCPAGKGTRIRLTHSNLCCREKNAYVDPHFSPDKATQEHGECQGFWILVFQVGRVKVWLMVRNLYWVTACQQRRVSVRYTFTSEGTAFIVFKHSRISRKSMAATVYNSPDMEAT